MKKVYFTLSIGYPNADRSTEMEFEDDATEEEIQEAAQEWANEHIEVSVSTQKPKSFY